MNSEKRKRLQKKGWSVGPAEEFLQLTPQEAALVELRLKPTGVSSDHGCGSTQPC
jgi:hypothetical protein